MKKEKRIECPVCEGTGKSGRYDSACHGCNGKGYYIVKSGESIYIFKDKKTGDIFRSARITLTLPRLPETLR